MQILSAIVFLLALAARALGAGEVTVTASVNLASVLPGDQIVVAVVLDHQEGWHSQADDATLKRAKSALAAVPTQIVASGPKAFIFGPAQWPAAVAISAAALGDPSATIPAFEGRAIAYVPVVILANAPPGKATITIEVKYQACDDSQCLFPTTESIAIDVVVRAPGDASRGVPADPADFAAFDRDVFAKMLSGEVSSAQPLVFNFFGRTITVSTSGLGFLLILLLAVLGGILLNFTPCVLPVVPIKIMSLQHAAGTAQRRILLGWVMFFGVVAFWLGIGSAIAFISTFKAINQLFQIPAFSIGVGVFILAMAVGMLGVFAVKLPDWVYSIDPKRESIPGSFIFGVMTAVLSTPCTAPFMGTAAAWAADEPAHVSLSTFAAIGVGMGLPYLILALFPGLVAKVPRTGPASELIKQVMGILMLAVAAFFIGSGIDPLLRLPVDPPIRGHWWVVGGLTAAAGLWLAWRVIQIARRPLPRLAWLVVGLLLAAAGGWMGVKLSDHGPIKWVGYTPERFAAAQKEGKIVVLDFTAEWCINCKVLENGILHQKPIVDLFERGEAIPMRVDFTGSNPPGQAKLKEHSWVGIPLLVITGPGAAEPMKFDTYTVETVLKAVEKARPGGAGKP